MSREEWARSAQGKKAEHSRCGLEIEAKRSDDGLRLDMPNRGRIGRVRPNDGDTTERQARHTAWRRSRHDEETRACTAEGFPGPSDQARSHDADRNAPTSVAARRPSTQGQTDISDSQATRTGPSRRHGSVRRQQRPPSPVAGLRITMHARMAPPRGGAFVLLRKVNDQAKASDAGMASASRRLADLGRLRLKLVQIGHGALRVRGRGENEALLVGQQLQPRCHVTRVIGARLEFGHDSKIGA